MVKVDNAFNAIARSEVIEYFANANHIFSFQRRIQSFVEKWFYWLLIFTIFECKLIEMI
jgi:hypothetical protein